MPMVGAIAALASRRSAREDADTVDVAYALDLWAAVLRGFSEMMLGLPGKIGRELPHLTAHDLALIDQVCRDGLKIAALERGRELTPL